MNNFEIVLTKNDKDILVANSVEVAKNLGVNHKDLLKKIDGYIQRFGGEKIRYEFYIESTYENRGKQYRNYLITKKGIAQLIGGYSSAVEKAFDLNVAYINRFEEMENEIRKLAQPKLPQTYLEALKELVAKEEALQLANQTILEQTPKVEYHDKVLQPDKLVTTTQIAKDLGMSAIKLNRLLNDKGILFKKSNTWFFYDKYQHMIPEYADYIIGENFQQLKWTEKGRKWIIELLKEAN